MAFFTGSGGAGDATTDSSSQAIAATEAAAQAAASASAAATSATNAASSATSAATSATTASNAASTATSQANLAASQATASLGHATEASLSATDALNAANNASASETNAATYSTLANEWAVKTGGTVDGSEYSAKYYALQAETTAQGTIDFKTNLNVSASTLAAGASATASYDDDLVRITFGIPQGEPGATGPAGADGTDGVGVPAGGTTGQVLAKKTDTDYDTEWVTGGGGGGSGDVVGPASATDNAIARYDGTTGKLIQNSGVTIGDTGNTVISVTDNSNAALRITQTGTGNALLVEDSSNPDSTPFVIDANGMIISGYTGSLAIGSETPNIQTNSGSSTNNGFGNYSWTASSGASYFDFAKSRSSTIGTNTIVQSGDSLGFIKFYGDDGSAFIESARISAAVDGTPGTNDMPGRLVFSTTADGASSPTERMRLDSAGNLGLGVTPYGWGSSFTALDLRTYGSLASTTTNTYLYTNAYYNGTSWIYKQTAAAAGYSQNTGSHVWYKAPSGTAGNAITFTQAMTLDASGNLLLGTTSNAAGYRMNVSGTTPVSFNTVNNTSYAASGATTSSPDGTSIFNFNNNTAAADKFNGVIVGSLGGTGAGQYAYFGAVSTSSGFVPHTVFGVRSATSSYTERMRITSDGYLRMASGTLGIQFGGNTAAANALDDYEEGTFTPTIIGVSTAGTGTYSVQSGRYTKIGNRVCFQIYLVWSAHTGTGNMRVAGLPFTSNSTANSFSTTSFWNNNIALAANSYMQGYVNINSTQIYLEQVTTGGGATTSITLDTAGSIMVAGQYEV